MLADGLTKALLHPKHGIFIKQLSLINIEKCLEELHEFFAFSSVLCSELGRCVN